jgi:hypothetical protein
MPPPECAESQRGERTLLADGIYLVSVSLLRGGVRHAAGGTICLCHDAGGIVRGATCRGG